MEMAVDGAETIIPRLSGHILYFSSGIAHLQLKNKFKKGKRMEKAIIFGSGRYFQSKKEALLNQYEIIGFLDNIVKPEEIRKFEGKDVVNPENLESFQMDAVIILMSAAYWDMWEQLIGLDVDPRRIKFAVLMKPSYDKVEQMLSDTVEEITTDGSAIIMCENGRENVFMTQEQYKVYLRKLFSRKDKFINLIADLPYKPVSKRFALERGTAIDRIYIEQFLKANKDKIQGTVMEMADLRYTKMFGQDVQQSQILHVNGWGKGVIQGNLETGEGISENSVDCFICTQTIQFIYDIHSTVRNIYKMLKPGGAALVTAHCLGQISLYDYHNWGEYWRLTDQSMKKIFTDVFDDSNVCVQSRGNMKTAVAYLYGLCAEDLKEEDFEFHDEQYPVIVTVMAKK